MQAAAASVVLAVDVITLLINDILRFNKDPALGASGWQSFDFFDKVITPVWVDNQHLIEVIPGVRFEAIPRLVFEAGLGISVTPQLREIHQFRLLLGATYEFGGK